MSATLYDAVFSGAGGSLKQCTSAEFSAGNEIFAARQSGAIDPSALYLTSGEPRARWTSLDLGGALSLISATAGLYETTGIVLPYRRRSAGSTYEGSSSHVKLTGTKGLIVPTQFG